jgi:hypothetical protein
LYPNDNSNNDVNDDDDQVYRHHARPVALTILPPTTYGIFCFGESSVSSLWTPLVSSIILSRFAVCYSICLPRYKQGSTVRYYMIHIIVGTDFRHLTLCLLLSESPSVVSRVDSTPLRSRLIARFPFKSKRFLCDTRPYTRQQLTDDHRLCPFLDKGTESNVQSTCEVHFDISLRLRRFLSCCPLEVSITTHPQLVYCLLVVECKRELIG